MKKVLLIGELGEIVRSINECLMDDFQIQLCPGQAEMVKEMAKIIKPDLMIVCQIGMDDLNGTIFSWAAESMPDVPVLIISTEEYWGQIKSFCQTGQFEKLFRPVTGEMIVETCLRMMEEGVRPDSEMHEHAQDTENTDQSDKTEKESSVLDKLTEENLAREVLTEPRYKIMIVDDSPLVLRNMKNVLESEFTVFVAPSGKKALDLIPKRQPDLVLLDYEMPGMDGKDVFEAMMEDEYMKTIPVIFLSGISQKKRVYNVLQSMPAGYILKPADKDRLMNEIKKVLK